MTLDEAKQKLNCKKSKDLAAFLEISPEAVSQWNPECIPKRREYEVLEKELLFGLVHKQTVNQNFAESNV